MIIVGGMRVSLKAVNDEVARRVVKPRKSGDYFFFRDWPVRRD